MKPTKEKENQVVTTNSDDLDVEFYVRKAHTMRSQAVRVYFAKIFSKSANDSNPKPTMPKAV